MRTVGRALWLVAACCVSVACGEASRDAAPEVPPEPPSAAPRWVAISSRERLLVVRFDDVTRPEEVVLSAIADGEQSDSEQVYWSPTGEHLAFLTSAAGGAPTLWVASASDGFQRRALMQPESSVSAWGPALSQRALFWIGPNALVLRVPSEGGIAFYRVSVATLAPELIGSFENEPGDLGAATDNVLSAASRFGFLFTTGSRSRAELHYAAESGSPLRLGSALSMSGDGTHYDSAELVWAPDGRSANFWSTAVSDGAATSAVGQLGQYPVPDAEPPMLALEPDLEPKLGLVHLPRHLVVDAHPHGNLSYTEEVSGRALAPTGGAVAYTLRHSLSDDYRLLFGVPMGSSGVSGATALEGGVGHALPPQFGFLNAATLFYPELVPETDPAREPQVRCVLWRGGEKRELSVDRYAPATFRAIPDSDILYFVREDAARHADLFRVDLGDESARAEPIPLTGSVLLDSALPQGRTFGRGYGMLGGSDAGAALLVSTSTVAECRELGHQCETARWVVNLTTNGAITRLESRWLSATLNWAVDGSGLLAVDREGLSFVPSADYRGSFELSAEVGVMIVPDSWPPP
ncbi:MAG TPA: hypothetical protein VG937_18135 [Polyangiaceae bacterium]|nr:hypothetical protein [Polyangiaceae bacterium]